MFKLVNLQSLRIYDTLERKKEVRRHLTTLSKHNSETYEHSRRVAMLSIDLSHDNNCTRNEMQLIGYAGLLHDIGKT